MSKIKSIFAYEILDSRGFPTVACTVVTNKGNVGKAKVPSGASTGEREALELRDGDTKRFNGKGVLKAVSNINEIIAPKLIDQEFNVYDQEEIDNFMIKLDGTDFKKNLGANATLAVSLAVADAAAKDKEKPLYRYIKNNIVGDKSKEYVMPVPMLNVINGGAHADNTIDFQEFMIQPISANSIQEACRIASECFHSLAKLLKADGYNTSKGDEGGFAPKLKSAEEALEYMTKAVTAAGYVPGKDITFALDTACSELYEDGKYTFAKAVKAKFTTPSDGGNVKTTEQMITYLESLVAKFPILSIEDGLGENDREG
jgi:enolase